VEFSSRVEKLTRASEEWLERHPRAGRPLWFLREHWVVALSVVSLCLLVLFVNPIRIAGLFLSANRRDLLLMAPCLVAIYVFKGVGWWVTLKQIGSKVSVWRSIYVMFAGRTLIFLPTGDLARVALLKETGERRSKAGAIAGTIAFQELVYTGLVGLGVLPRIADHPELILLVVVMAAAHAGIFLILLWKRFYDWAVGVVERVRLFRRFDDQLRSLRPAFVQMTTPAVLVQVVFWNALAVLTLMLMFYLSILAVTGTRVGPAQTTFAYGLGHILGGLSLLPSGMGAMEAIVAGLLVTQGVPFYAGVAGVILFRAYNDALSALIGGAVMAVGRRLGD
jgi:uncharacterized membrane protein YbhN (UPF0104 family)